jgi:hypothetical protein
MTKEQVLIEQLVDCLSFDRPIQDKEKLRQARDILLAFDHPVGNDWRSKEHVFQYEPYLALIAKDYQ